MIPRADGGQTDMTLDVEAAGSFSLTTTSRNGATILATSIETGRYRARDGRYSSNATGEPEVEGSYQILAGNGGLETTGPAGTVRWVRQTAAASTGGSVPASPVSGSAAGFPPAIGERTSPGALGGWPPPLAGPMSGSGQIRR